MSDPDSQSVQYFLQWIKDGGLTQWIEYFVSSGDEAKIKQCLDIFNRIKSIFLVLLCRIRVLVLQCKSATKWPNYYQNKIL